MSVCVSVFVYECQSVSVCVCVCACMCVCACVCVAYVSEVAALSPSTGACIACVAHHFMNLNRSASNFITKNNTEFICIACMAHHCKKVGLARTVHLHRT
jgi:hypothetical protein